MWHSRSNVVIIVKGPHIPAISSEEGFFDILHLKVFIILSTAFDNRFYESEKCPPTLIDEVAYACRHFYSILHQVFQRFHILLDGVDVSVMYVMERMLAEFTATSVVLAKNLPGDQVGDNIDFSTFVEHIEGILKESHPPFFPYYSRCMDHGHKHFLWTGPQLKILPRLEELTHIIPITELQDLPTHSIYDVVLNTAPPPATTPPTGKHHIGKRQERGNDSDVAEEQPKKRKH